MQPKVSVIIPVYNNERYLVQCLDSVVNQTLKDIQIILVNDGSSDHSPEICREYADKYSYVEYYSQINKGSAAARNNGLDYAKGEYVGFIDSDDWVEANMYEELYNAAKRNNDSDIVFCRAFEKECPGSYEYIFPEYGYYDRKKMIKDIYPYMMPHVTPKGNFRSIRWSNCLRIYKKSIIDHFHIRSCEGVSNCEDLGFNVECCIHSNSYYYLNEQLYHNRPNPSSQSRNYIKNMWGRTRKLILDMERFISSYDDGVLEPAFDVCIFYFFTMVIQNEMRLKNRKDRLLNIQVLLDDSVCREIMKKVGNDGMNNEYSGIYAAILTGKARQVDVCMNKLNFKKRKLYPILSYIISLPHINKWYRIVRKKG